MRTIVTVCLGLALAACAPASEGSLLGAIWPDKTKEAQQAREEAQGAADDAKCREFGFEPRTEAYGNCRLQLEQIRAIERASVQTRWSAAQPTQGGKQGLSLLCKDAISRGDSGGTFVFC